MANQIKARVQPIQATAAAFTAANPVLLSGEWGYETDTGRIKSGDGVTAYTDLPYALNIDQTPYSSLPGTEGYVENTIIFVTTP